MKVTEGEYTTIKQLLQKYNGKRVAQIVGRGIGTVSTVKNTDSYEAYRNRPMPKSKPKAQQLPLEPKTERRDLRESVWLKLNALYDEIVLYRTTVVNKDANRDLGMAIIKLEEAEMWLKRH